jgi:hypothetical protein
MINRTEPRSTRSRIESVATKTERDRIRALPAVTTIPLYGLEAIYNSNCSLEMVANAAIAQFQKGLA